MDIIEIIILAVLGVFLIGVVWFLIKREKRTQITQSTMTTKQMMYVVTLSTLAIVVGFFEIPIGVTGLKFDFSEIVILLSFLMLGFKSTSVIILLRSVVRFVLPAKTGAEAEIIIKLLGEVIAMLASFLLVFSYQITKKIFRKNEKPLLLAIPTEVKEPSIAIHIVNAVLSALLLTIGITIFHILFTVPIYTSYLFNQGKHHFFITTYLSDPNYNDSLIGVIKYVIIMFGLMNVIKGALSSVLFLILKPRVENAVK